MTDDERREVAARLRSLDDEMRHVRRAYDDDGVTTACDEQSDYYQIYDTVFGSLPPEYMTPYDYKEFHDRLADLIEPQEKVCRNLGDLDLWEFRCSKCGLWYEVPSSIFRYCPGCGARIAGDAL